MKNNGDTDDEKRKMQFERARCSDKMAGRSTDDGAPPILRSSSTDQILWGHKVKEWPPIGRCLFKFLVKRDHKIPSNSCKFSGALSNLIWFKNSHGHNIVCHEFLSYALINSNKVHPLHSRPRTSGEVGMLQEAAWVAWVVHAARVMSSSITYGVSYMGHVGCFQLQW